MSMYNTYVKCQASANRIILIVFTKSSQYSSNWGAQNGPIRCTDPSHIIRCLARDEVRLMTTCWTAIRLIISFDHHIAVLKRFSNPWYGLGGST